MRKTAIYGVMLIIGVCIIGVYIWKVGRAPSEFALYIFDTKGKPSFFIRTPDDQRILIDGGANSEIIRRLTKILPFYTRRIDTTIVTADDEKHVSGLIDVINRYRVSSVTVPRLATKKSDVSSSTDQIYETFLSTVGVLGVPLREVGAGERLDFGQKLHISVQSTSSPELTLHISYGETSVLLLGDIGIKAQKLLASSSDVRSTVLVVPHSISASSLNLGLINKVSPQFMVYSQTSASKNKKADPLYMILDDHRFNIKQKSTIEVLSDGETVQIRANPRI